MRRSLLLLPVLLLSCREEAEPSITELPPENIAAPGALGVSPDPPPPRPPAPDFAGLSPLTRAEIERELAPGAGCSLDGPLLVAVDGDAIVKEGGRVRHLKPKADNLAELFQGGRFVGDGLVVEVRREHEIERVDEVTTWQATLDVKRGRSGFTTYHMRWSCGA